MEASVFRFKFGRQGRSTQIVIIDLGNGLIGFTAIA